MTVQDTPDWYTVDQGALATVIANAIKSAGVPPIDNPALLAVQFNQAVASGATTNLTGHINVSKYQSFHCKLQSAPVINSGTAPYIKAEFDWSLVADSYDPTVIDHVVYKAGPNGSTPYSVLGHGPVYGDTLDISFTNYDSVTQNITYAVFGSYRTRNRFTFRGGAAMGGADATGLGTDSIVGAYQPGNVAAGTTAARVDMMLFDGPVLVSASSGLPAGYTGSWNVQIEPQPAGIIGAIIVLPAASGAFNLVQQAVLPRRVCNLTISNATNSLMTNPQVVVTGWEQPE